jgi:transcriptional regulator with XRE-family HTH domain
MAGRRRRIDELPANHSAIVGANIRILRQRRDWSQARLGELMGWPTNSTVCAAEGRRNGRQRGFTTYEVERLAAIFGIPIWQLATQCANCEGHPPVGFSCLTCGALGRTGILEV